MRLYSIQWVEVDILSDPSIIQYTCLDTFNFTGYEPGSRYTLNIPRKSPVATPNHLNLLESLNSPKTLVAMERDSSPEGRTKQIILVGYENWDRWSRITRLKLLKKDLWRFVTTDAGDNQSPANIRKMADAAFILTSTISDDLFKNVKDTDNPRKYGISSRASAHK